MENFKKVYNFRTGEIEEIELSRDEVIRRAQIRQEQAVRQEIERSKQEARRQDIESLKSVGPAEIGAIIARLLNDGTEA